jgi:NADH-quinone oxidoreductase subunit G
MEGSRDPLPPSLRSFEWAPGWNSEQATARLTAEARQAGYAEGAGVRLLEHRAKTTGAGTAGAAPPDVAIPPAFAPAPGRYLVVDAPLVFGTEEQSARARALSTLTPAPWIELSAEDARAMGAATGDLLEVTLGGEVLVLPLRDDTGLPRGVARLPRDLPALERAWGVALPGWASIQRSVSGSRGGGA